MHPMQGERVPIEQKKEWYPLNIGQDQNVLLFAEAIDCWVVLLHTLSGTSKPHSRNKKIDFSMQLL